MELEDLEEGRVTRRSTRSRNPPTTPPTAATARGRGRGGGRGRGRGGRSSSKGNKLEIEEEADNSGGDMSADEQEESQSSDSENSNSNNTANGIESSVDSSGAGQPESQGEISENIGYSMSTTADLTDTSAIMDTFADKIDQSSSDSADGETFMQRQEHFETPVDAKNEPSAMENDNQFASQQEQSEEENSMDTGNAIEMETEETNSKRKLEERVSEEVSKDCEDLNTSADAGPTPAKKPLLEINVRKLLPDLEKHWKPVEDDPNDFTAWTYLLQYVDQESELLAAREAYDKFLTKYPYCYGYWKKYADYEKRKGSAEDCEQVFRRGLKSISLSVDLWIHYLNYVKATHDSQPEIIRSQFEASITACGMEFRSDKLWEHYIQWERENNNLSNVLAIYDRLISTPTQSFQNHFQNLKELVNQYSPTELLSPDEYADLKGAVVPTEGDELDAEAEANKIKEKIIERRTEMYKKNEGEITIRWTFEEAIKRPYFHVKPLEKGQLKMWKEYLEFEIEKGDTKRILILFERCLIACALYEEYWIKYARFLKDKTPELIERTRDVFIRACTVHHPNKPWINLYWSSFEEAQGNLDRAAEILDKLEKETPESLIIYFRRINLERRRGNLSKCSELFEGYITEIKNKNKANAAHLSIKYARFLLKVVGDYEKSKKVLQEAVDIDESTRAKTIMALVDLAVDKTPIDVELALSAFDLAINGELPEEQKVTFAHRKIEFLEDHGVDVESVDRAQDELQVLVKVLRAKKSAAPHQSKTDDATTKNGAEDPSKSAAATGTNTGSNGAGPNDQYAYGQQYNQYANYANWNHQQSSGYGYNQQGWNAYQGYYGGTDSTTGA